MTNQIPYVLSRYEKSRTRAMMGGGAVLAFLAEGRDTGGQFSLFEAKGLGDYDTTAHMHAKEDESYYMLEGEGIINVGDHEFVIKAGDFAYLPRNVVHRFRATSPTFRVHIGLFPAGLEEFFYALSTPHSGNVIPPITNEPPPPDVLAQIEEMSRKFGIGFH